MKTLSSITVFLIGSQKKIQFLLILSTGLHSCTMVLAMIQLIYIIYKLITILMARRVTEGEKKEILKSFNAGESIREISLNFKSTDLYLIRFYYITRKNINFGRSNKLSNSNIRWFFINFSWFP